MLTRSPNVPSSYLKEDRLPELHEIVRFKMTEEVEEGEPVESFHLFA